ncbi:MAG TPA: hypothetical protein VGO73_00580 [Pyrinomonadaceae bacterium]|jgi:hypothetical protein|nr:hypothetical protein [Pyrinomonadaceae bacterium]
MVEEVLVRENLSAQEIVCGEELLRRVKRAGITVAAAYWVRDRTESGSWKLDIVTPEVDKEGPLKLYERIHELVRIPSRIPCGLDINIIEVLGLKYSFFKMLKSAFKSEEPLSSVRLSEFVVGDGVFDLYIYEFPATNNHHG